MFEFRKKETPIANIAFMSIMAAINVVFALLMAFIPYIMFIIILILPLCSVLVALYCQKRYYPIYIIVTLGLCFVSAIWDPSIAIFYILPAMITGFIFALFVKLRLSNIYLIVVPSIIQLLFSILGLYISYLITGLNALETLRSLLALQDFELYYVVSPSLILTICLIQSLFSYMIIKDELPKFGYEICENRRLFIINCAVNLSLLLLTLITSFFSKTLFISYMALIISSVFSFEFVVDHIIEKSKLFIILDAVALLISIICFSICYQYLTNGTAFLVFGGFYFIVTLFAIINNFFVNRKNLGYNNKV